ncbi:DUF6262 family protein [Streptomyces sp. ISL-1]|uniref:DUF6262 family protein n=1 Tax=Streptomyces sp. ISL-1 TaxID=2817657 RepID=UPI0027E59145|nr:DUF6262 family protein [Streptomyces sp. ISL-1]
MGVSIALCRPVRRTGSTRTPPGCWRCRRSIRRAGGSLRCGFRATASPPQAPASGGVRHRAAKTEAAEKAIRTLVKRGEPITFQAVQREAGVSYAFLYNHPDLRGRIERLRAQARPVPAPAPPADEQTTLVLALTSQITRLKKRHREEVRALRDALEQTHGENLDLRRELACRGGTTAAPQ